MYFWRVFAVSFECWGVWSQDRIVEIFFQDQKVVLTAKLYSMVCRWLGPDSRIYVSQLNFKSYKFLSTGHCDCAQLWLCVITASWGHPSVKWCLEINFLHRFVHSGLCKSITQCIYWDSRISIVYDWLFSSRFNNWRLMLSQCKVLIASAAALCSSIQKTVSDFILFIYLLPRCLLSCWMFLLSVVVVHIHVQVRKEPNFPRNKVFPTLPTIQNTRHVCFCNPETRGQASSKFSSNSLFSCSHFLEFLWACQILA